MEFRETLGQLEGTSMQSTIPSDINSELADAQAYVADAPELLLEALKKINSSYRAHERMQHHNVEFGITKNRDTFSTLTLTRGHYHQIGSTDGNRVLVIYKEAKHVGFGLFDEDLSTCLPLDLDELMDEIKQEVNSIVVRMSIEMILVDMHQLSDPED